MLSAIPFWYRIISIWYSMEPGVYAVIAAADAWSMHTEVVPDRRCALQPDAATTPKTSFNVADAPPGGPIAAAYVALPPLRPCRLACAPSQAISLGGSIAFCWYILPLTH